MSERMDQKPIDEAALAAYLKGGSDVSQRYREASDDSVPRELDERVLALARAAANKKRGGSPWVRWSAPLALAASAVLVVSIVLESGVHKDEAAMLARPTTAPVSVTPPRAEIAEEVDVQRALEDAQRDSAAQAEARAVAPQAPLAAAQAAKATKAEEVAVSARRAQRLLEESPTSVSVQEAEFVASPPAPRARESAGAESDIESAVVAAPRRPANTQASDSARVEEIAVTGARARRDAPRASGPRNTVRPLAAPSAAADARENVRTPEEWLEDIRELRRDGRDDEADDEWRRFREAHPDYAVAESDPARRK